MAVRVRSNDLPDPKVRADVEEAVLRALGTPDGDWLVEIHENQQSRSWYVTIEGPNNFYWDREFLGLEEQTTRDGYAFIRRAISQDFSPPVSMNLVAYISYAQADGADGFVSRLRYRLAQELKVQTAAPTEVVWDEDRMVAGAMTLRQSEALIRRALMLVPAVSPSYFQSEDCRKEFEIFLEREQRTGRSLIFPVYCATAEEFESPEHLSESKWAQALKSRNYLDFRNFRFDLTFPAPLALTASLAKSMAQSHVQIIFGSDTERAHRPRGDAKMGQPVYVESPSLRNFRCFDHLHLEFNKGSNLDGRWTCIAGVNGAGKSSVLQALGLALLGNPLAIELGLGRLKRMRRNVDLINREPAEVRVGLRIEGSEPFELNMTIEEGRIVSTDETQAAPPHPPFPWDRLRRGVIVGYGATRNLSSRVDSGYENLSTDTRRQITLFEPLAQLARSEVLLARQPANDPLVALLRNLLQKVFDTDLQIHANGSEIRFLVAGRDIVEAIDLPDGFRAAAAWLADLCAAWCEQAPALAASSDPADIRAIVLIDEIDLHLHPSLQRALVPRLRKALPKVQWIVTTHSPLVLANFDANEIIALDRDQDGNIRELDRQILGFTSDEIYEWLMGTEPTGVAMEEELRKSDEGAGMGPEEMAVLMRTAPQTNGAEARKQLTEFQEILKAVKRRA